MVSLRELLPFVSFYDFASLTYQIRSQLSCGRAGFDPRVTVDVLGARPIRAGSPVLRCTIAPPATRKQ